MGPRRFGAWLVAAVLLAGCGGAGGNLTSSDHRPQPTSGLAIKKVAPSRPPVKLTVEVNGDLLIHSPVWERALRYGHGQYDFSPMLREIAPYIKRADLAICHVETPMTPRPPTGYPVFNTPPALATAIKRTGWRICDTASNHSLDEGQYGIDQTGLALDRAGRPSHRLVRLAGRAEPNANGHREGGAGSFSRLHRDDQRDLPPAPVVGQPRRLSAVRAAARLAGSEARRW